MPRLREHDGTEYVIGEWLLDVLIATGLAKEIRRTPAQKREVQVIRGYETK